MTDHLDRLKAALADRYAIEREIGRGGMAVVYLAQDLKHERLVAIKVLRPELAAALGAERFHQEIKIAANLHHPHILPLYDSGDADGSLYYVMPYEEGQSLREKLAKEGELPIAEAARVLRDIVKALKHAHKNNVVHRDIKPDNIMLAEDHALVTDFGVAKAVSEATGRQKLTTEGVALGTPAYMAPEQAAADPHIDHRADIYAVGVIAYELLTGRTPFVGTTQQELLAAHVTQTPDPVTKYRESVPPALAEMVMKCLEKKAADRWQSAEELLPLLEAFTTPSGGVTPTGMMPVDRVAKRRWMMFGGAVALAAVIAIVVVMAALPRGSNVALDPNHVVVSVFRNETGDPSLDQLGSRTGHWITQGLQQAAIPVTPWDMALQSWDYVQGEAEAGRVRNQVRTLAEETGAGTVISGVVYLEGDSIEIQVDVTDATRGRLVGSPSPVRGTRVAQGQLIEDVQQQVMVFLSVNFDERLRDITPNLISEAPSYEAYQAFREGWRLHSAASGSSEEAIGYFRRAFEADSTWALPLMRIRQAFHNMSRIAERDSVTSMLEGLGETLTPYERATLQYFQAQRDRDFREAVVALRRAAALAPQSTSVHNLGVNLIRVNRPREALNVLLTMNPERGWLREWRPYWFYVASALHMLGEYPQELDAAQRCRQLHPESPWCLFDQAVALMALGRIEEFHRVFAEFEEKADPSNDPLSIPDLVALLRYSGHDEVSKSLAIKNLTWHEGRPLNEATRLNNRHEYGRALFMAGRIDEAQSTFNQIVADYPNDVVNRTYRAYVSAMRGETALARSDLDALEAQAELLEGPDKDEIQWWCRAVIYGALGDRERAFELFRLYEARWTYSKLETARVIYEPMRGYAPFEELMRPKG